MAHRSWAATTAAVLLAMTIGHAHANELTGRTGETYQSPVPGTAYAGQIPVTVNGETVGYANLYQPVGADGQPQPGGAYSAISADSDLGRDLQRAGANVVNGQIVLEQAGPNVGVHWTARPGEQPGSNEYWRDAQIPTARGGGSIDVWYNLPPEPEPPPPSPPPAPEPEPQPTNPTCGPNEANWFGTCIPLAPRTPDPAPAPAPPVQQTPEPEPQPPAAASSPAPQSPPFSYTPPPSQSPPSSGSGPQPGGSSGETGNSWQPVYTPSPRTTPSRACVPRPDTRALFVPPVSSPHLANTALEVGAQINGEVRGAVVAVTSWGTEQEMAYRDGAWYAAVWVPSTVVGEQSVLVLATLTLDLGCGMVVGPNHFSGITRFDVIGGAGQGGTVPEMDGVPGIVMSLQQYVRSCLTVWAPGWCALSDRAALLLRQELASVATQYYAMLGRDKYVELVRRIEAILHRNGLTGRLDPVWLPEDLRREDLWTMQPLRLSD